jgi:hypothetical protein
VSDFPCHVYRSPGAHPGPPVDGRGTTYDCLGVVDDAALQAALSAGWRRTLPEAVGVLLPAPAGTTFAAFDEEAALASPFLPGPDVAQISERLPVASVARAELDERAKALGVKLDRRTSDADLAKKIADAEARG